MAARVPSLLIVQARREFVRLPHGLAWRHPRYGYVARSDSMRTYWAHTDPQPSPDNQLRGPSGRQREFRSVDGAIAALVRHRVEVNTARVMQHLDDAKTRRADREIAHLDRKAPR